MSTKEHLVLEVAHEVSSYLAGDGIFVFLQVGDGLSDPHVDGAYDSVHVVGAVDAIGHPDQGIWGNKAGTALTSTGQNKARTSSCWVGEAAGPSARLHSHHCPAARLFSSLCVGKATLCGRGTSCKW